MSFKLNTALESGAGSVEMSLTTAAFQPLKNQRMYRRYREQAHAHRDQVSLQNLMATPTCPSKPALAFTPGCHRLAVALNYNVEFFANCSLRKAFMSAHELMSAFSL